MKKLFLLVVLPFLFLGIASPVVSAGDKTAEQEIAELESEIVRVEKMTDKEFFDFLDDRIARLKENADAMKDKEQSFANRMLGGATMAATGLGGMQLASGISEKRADEEADADMKAYLSTFRCGLSGGLRNKVGGEMNIGIPVGDQAKQTQLRMDFDELSAKIKMYKTDLGLKPGLESEVVIDKSSLYQNGGVGITGHKYSTVADRIASGAAAKKIQTGALIAGAGVVTGIAGNALINYNKNAARESSDKILRDNPTPARDVKTVIDPVVDVSDPVVVPPENPTTDPVVILPKKTTALGVVDVKNLLNGDPSNITTGLSDGRPTAVSAPAIVVNPDIQPTPTASSTVSDVKKPVEDIVTDAPPKGGDAPDARKAVDVPKEELPPVVVPVVDLPVKEAPSDNGVNSSYRPPVVNGPQTIDPRRYLTAEEWAKYPYSAIGHLNIQAGWSFFSCTGQFVSPVHFLTAAHCLDKNGKYSVEVSSGQNIVLDVVYSPSEYPRNSNYDIALLKVAGNYNHPVWLKMATDDAVGGDDPYLANAENKSKNTDKYGVQSAGFGGLRILNDSEISTLKGLYVGVLKNEIKEIKESGRRSGKTVDRLLVEHVKTTKIMPELTGDTNFIKGVDKCIASNGFYSQIVAHDCKGFSGNSGGPVMGANNVLVGVHARGSTEAITQSSGSGTAIKVADFVKTFMKYMQPDL